MGLPAEGVGCARMSCWSSTFYRHLAWGFFHSRHGDNTLDPLSDNSAIAGGSHPVFCLHGQGLQARPLSHHRTTPPHRPYRTHTDADIPHRPYRHCTYHACNLILSDRHCFICKERSFLMAGACISGPRCVTASVVCICDELGFGIGKGGHVRRASWLADRTSRVVWCNLFVCVCVEGWFCHS